MTPSRDELVDGAPVALLAVNVNGEVLAHNAGLSGWLDPAASAADRDLRGRNLVEWLSPASRLLYETRILPDLLQTGSVREVVLDVRDLAGRQGSVLINANLRTSEQGERQVFIAVMDAADRIAFERELVAARRSSEVAHERLSLLQEATSRIALAQGPADLGEALAAAAGRATQAAWATARIVRRREAAAVLDAAAQETAGEWGDRPPGLLAPPVLADVEEQLVCRNPAELRERFGDAASALADAGVEAMLITPILRPGGPGEPGEPLGEIRCWFRRGRSFDEEMLETLRALAVQAELVIDHLDLQERMRHRALHDELTGLANRVLLEEQLGRLVAAAARSGRPCAVLFLDLDGFKAINDRLGHGAGDEVLRIVAERLRAVCRAGETVSRLGGDEFVVAAGGIDVAGATELARRIWQAVRSPLEGAAAGAPLSSSVGVVRWDPAASSSQPSADALLAAADAAMYAAKHGGKDGIEVRTWGG